MIDDWRRQSLRSTTFIFDGVDLSWCGVPEYRSAFVLVLMGLNSLSSCAVLEFIFLRGELRGTKNYRFDGLWLFHCSFLWCRIRSLMSMSCWAAAFFRKIDSLYSSLS